MFFVLFFSVLCLVYQMLPVSLNCHVLMFPLIFSNVYLRWLCVLSNRINLRISVAWLNTIYICHCIFRSKSSWPSSDSNFVTRYCPKSSPSWWWSYGRWTYIFVQVSGFSPGTPASSTNKIDRHDIADILLKVALNTINLSLTLTLSKIKIIWKEKLCLKCDT
jgi:hypothetical protein